MIELGTKKLTVVKCPANSNELQLARDCISCSYVESHLKGNLTCSYDEAKKEMAHEYIRKEMTKEDIKEFLKEK